MPNGVRLRHKQDKTPLTHDVMQAGSMINPRFVQLLSQLSSAGPCGFFLLTRAAAVGPWVVARWIGRGPVARNCVFGFIRL